MNTSKDTTKTAGAQPENVHEFEAGSFGPTTEPLCKHCGLSEMAQTHGWQGDPELLARASGKPELPHDMTQTRTEESVNWSKVFCPICQPIVDGHFIKREHEWQHNAEQYRETIERLSAHAAKLAEALRDAIEQTRFIYGQSQGDNQNLGKLQRGMSKALSAYEEARK